MGAVKVKPLSHPASIGSACKITLHVALNTLRVYKREKLLEGRGIEKIKINTVRVFVFVFRRVCFAFDTCRPIIFGQDLYPNVVNERFYQDD